MTHDPKEAHVQTLREMFQVCANERRMREADALDAALAALTAQAEDVKRLVEAAQRVVARDPLELGFSDDIDALDEALQPFSPAEGDTP
jgi:hypothetical protein